MPDSCVADDASAGDASLSIALNGAGVLLGSFALAVAGAGACGGAEKGNRGNSFLPHARTLAFASVLLGVPTIAIYFAAGAGSELGCVAALTNSVGPIPVSLISAVAGIVALAADMFCFGGWSRAAVRLDGGPTRPGTWLIARTRALKAAAASLFPAGAGWRARDAAVAASAALVAAFSGSVLAFYDPYLRVPDDASWDVTLGALAVSSVCCGPLLVYLAAVELSTFARTDGNDDKMGGQSREGLQSAAPPDLLEPPTSLDIEGDAAGESAVPLLSKGPGRERRAVALFRFWLLRTLPSLAANLVVFQFFLFLPVYGTEVASERFGLGYSDASAVAWSAVGLTAAAVVFGHKAACTSRRRRSEGM